jgi:hypothetical protein
VLYLKKGVRVVLGTIRDKVKNKSMKKRVMALVILLCFISFFLLSIAYIISHSNHEHDQNGASGSCLICLKIKEARRMLNELRLPVAVTAIMLFNLFLLTVVISSAVNFLCINTPIKLKVRINN